MTRDVIAARYINDYRLELFFEDGKKGVVDFCKFLEKGGGEKLRNLEYFKKFSVNTELGILIPICNQDNHNV